MIKTFTLQQLSPIFGCETKQLYNLFHRANIKPSIEGRANWNGAGPIPQNQYSEDDVQELIDSDTYKHSKFYKKLNITTTTVVQSSNLPATVAPTIITTQQQAQQQIQQQTQLYAVYDAEKALNKSFKDRKQACIDAYNLCRAQGLYHEYEYHPKSVSKWNPDGKTGYFPLSIWQQIP